MSTAKKIKILLSIIILLICIYEFSTFSLLGGLVGPLGAGGYLVLGGVYLFIGILGLLAAIYLSYQSKYLAYLLGLAGLVLIIMFLNWWFI